MSKARQYTAEELVARARARYGGPEWIVMEQVASGTGRYASSWIDVAAVALWPSKGLIRVAMEIKASRQDFLRELKNPNKNAWARECFHEFWYVAPPHVIKEEELPEGAGWYKPRGTGLVTVRHAARRESPKLDDTLLAAFCRAAQNAIDATEHRIQAEGREADPLYAKARAWQEGAERFLKERHTWDNVAVGMTEAEVIEAVLEALRKATTSREAKKDRERLAAILGSFQRHLQEFHDFMTAFAFVGFHERDEAGEALLTSYPGTQLITLARARALAAGRQTRQKANEIGHAKRIVAFSEHLEAAARVILEGNGAGGSDEPR